MKVTSSGAARPVPHGRYYRSAARSIATSGQTSLAFDATETPHADLAIDAGDLVWTGPAVTLEGHLSLQCTGVSLLSGITARVIRIRGGVSTDIEVVPWKSVATAGQFALPDLQLRIQVERDDRIRVTFEPSGAILLPVPIVAGATYNHVDLRA